MRYFHVALIKASEKGYVSIVKMLVDAGAVINIHSNDGCCALIRSANYGHEDVVRILIAHPKTNVDIKSKSGNTGRTVNDQIDKLVSETFFRLFSSSQSC